VGGGVGNEGPIWRAFHLAVLFSVLLSFPDFRENRTIGSHLQQRAYSISSWPLGFYY
jgi:hypothetical protein